MLTHKFAGLVGLDVGGGNVREELLGEGLDGIYICWASLVIQRELLINAVGVLDL